MGLEEFKISRWKKKRSSLSGRLGSTPSGGELEYLMLDFSNSHKNQNSALTYCTDGLTASIMPPIITRANLASVCLSACSGLKSLKR